MTIDPTPTIEPDFISRHIGPDHDDVAAMLKVVGQPSIEAMLDTAMPGVIRNERALRLDAAPTEEAVIKELRALASRNTVLTQMIGLGYYGTVTPAVIRRNVFENPAWYTSYTPYQPEISQGRLEALINFQTVIIDLTGLQIASASLLDESTAAAEAMTLMRRASKSAPDAVMVVDQHVLPQSLGVMQTRAKPQDLGIVVADLSSVTTAEALTAAAGGKAVFGVIVQYPGADGELRDWSALATAAHEVGALVTAAADLLALTLATPPGEWGADVAVGSSQRFGVPMGFGGPHAGFMSVRTGLERTMPGRLVGLSIDADGHPAYRLALQTREQHIRREKATSNICTAQVLLAVMAAMYAVYHGPAGLARIARRVHGHATALAEGLRAGGVEVETQQFFDTITVRVQGRAAEVISEAAARGVNLWQVDADHVSVSTDETTKLDDLSAVWAAFGVPGLTAVAAVETLTWPSALVRTSEFLTHPVFHRHHSETAMMRYLRKLADRDYALDRGMIPLGSCTMKLNAATEMEAVSWPEFANLHPFAPPTQTEGIRAVVKDLEDWLCEITGYDAVSLQPNAGSQGELTGLLTIRAYHEARGESFRNICLIPASAHGTNAASAAMAGLKVVVVKTATTGEIEMEDLRAKVKANGENLAAIMVTYPSTHGVFEDTITELCELVHEVGGQVYVDGANLNALIGLAQPGKFGGDVSHLNLHKTFAIPHGGGGPGVGPVAVRSHLAPHLPNHPLAPEAGPSTGVGPVSGAPYGSASILPISWAYVRLMGGAGLTRATQVAILSANYIAARLRDSYPVLYSGNEGIVAHECILDLREITHVTGVSVNDVAKRLIDYGFHSPTMSFPVSGTLMVEPTESEDLVEIDRFCDAMIAIRGEIEQVARGEVSAADSVLHHAPHTAACLVEEWDHPYDRKLAAYPAGVDKLSKYWPAVRRLEESYGDRNLVCACPPIEVFEES
ncbi:MAG: aminomethyl-transferring glycine dehydrogenase [Phycicoccus sp.]|nr:aminomethyl-transferring glycine dehydrogenase [Phycicoccus sp.]NMM34691.1 aminomethyl-transferring glycine dehydrogenase [Phycicoccus sp.]